MRPYRSANGGWWPTFYYWEDVWIAGNEKKNIIVSKVVIKLFLMINI
jgi:hypothetical protein